MSPVCQNSVDYEAAVRALHSQLERRANERRGIRGIFVTNHEEPAAFDWAFESREHVHLSEFIT